MQQQKNISCIEPPTSTSRFTSHTHSNTKITAGESVRRHHYADTDAIQEPQTPLRGRRCPRPRSVWHKPYDYASFVETTRPASLSVSYGDVKRKAGAWH